VELVKPEYRVRTIHPFPETDPDFAIEMRKLSSSEMNRIYDRHGYNPGNKQTMGKLEKVLRDMACTAIVRVKGATQNGAPLDPEADETKLLLLEVPVEVDGETKSLWDYVGALAAEEEKREAKNSQRP